MQTFSNYFRKLSEDHPDETPRQPMGALSKQQAGDKVQQLIALVDGINARVDRVQSEIESHDFTPEEAEALKERIAALARDLEGTRLPPEAEKLAGTTTTTLSGLNYPESVQHIMKEAVGILKNILKG
tara:strand:+ start:1059 stop:1442 length:384 start_codon:yes stop_codon:yes gene_type:complete